MTYWREAATAFSIVLGWLLITWGVAELLTPWVWPIALGIGLLLIVGIKFLWVIISVGVYTLSRNSDESTGSGS